MKMQQKLWNVTCSINYCYGISFISSILTSQNSETTLTQTFVQKLNKMYTKIILNTQYVYTLYTRIVQMKSSYDHKCIRNEH